MNSLKETINNPSTNFLIRAFMIWTASHLIFFVLAGTDIDFFNTSENYNNNNGFWPFVNLIELPQTVFKANYNEEGNISGGTNVRTATQFNGLFYRYDFTELITYLIVGGTFVGIRFLKIKERQE